MPEPGPGTILVVDDDEAKRYTIAHVLRRAGFAIVEAGSAAEGLALARDRPDLVILDINLPDISGFEVCRRLKADPATSALPVLHVSATLVQAEDRVFGLDSGADAYLTDIVNPLELIATVRALLRAREAEEAARRAAREWQATFDAIGDGVLLLGPDDLIVRSNRAAGSMLGRPSPALVGRPVREFLPLETGDGGGCLLTRAIATGCRESTELPLDGRSIRVTVDPIAGEGGGVVCILSDVTERKRFEEELRLHASELVAADRRKDQFLAMLAHELRNPLAPVRNALEVIRLDPSDAGSVERARAMAGRQIAHMARLIEDLLDVSRITSGKIQLRREPLDLVAIVGRAAEAARPTIEADRHELAVALPTGPIWVEGDPTRLEQVLANLLNNASKYTEPGGRVDVSAAIEGDRAVVRVRDTGVGLGPDILPRVFDLFAQADRSLARAQGGLGIGLTLVRSLIELHGGSVAAASDGPGRGSEFLVRLPILADLPAPPAAKPPPGRGPTGSRPKRLLVVDDNVDSATSLARVLGLWGHEVRVAHGGPEAIEMIVRGPADLVLLDIGLPGMDGYRVAEHLRSRDDVGRPTLVALTGYGQDEDRRRSRESGIEHHLVKPVDLDVLRALVDRIAPDPRPDRA